MRPDTLRRGLLPTAVDQLPLSAYQLAVVGNGLDVRRLATLTTQIATTPPARAQQAAVTERQQAGGLLQPYQVVVGLARSLKRIFVTSRR
jgi:hypothetical protein